MVGEHDYIWSEQYPHPQKPSWGAFTHWIDLYYSNGEHGIIYEDSRSPYQLIKVINIDVTDTDENWKQAEFFEEHWQDTIEGLVKINSFTTAPVVSGITNTLKMQVRKASPQEALNILSILDMDNGDTLAMWSMEKAAYIGLQYPKLTKKEMIYRVAKAAYNITAWTGHGIGDLKENNFGFRRDGSAFIFDFILDESHKNYSIKDYENYLNVVVAETEIEFV